MYSGTGLTVPSYPAMGDDQPPTCVQQWLPHKQLHSGVSTLRPASLRAPPGSALPALVGNAP